MNRNKIVSTLLTIAMLLETLPVVNAHNITSSDDDISTVIDDGDIKYSEDINQDTDSDVFNNNSTNNDTSYENNNKNIEHVDENDISLDTPFVGHVEVDEKNIIEEIKEIDEESEYTEELINASTTSNDIDNTEEFLTAKSGVLEITLTDGEYIPDLTGNPDGYSSIVVKTIGNKKLVEQDYDNLRKSKIPNIDLSQSTSDSIPEGAFSNATHLTSFQFPQGIKSIDSASIRSNGAFYNCKKLKGNLVIPDSVTYIGDYAFSGCNGFTGNLVIPDSVTYIGDYAFSGCNGFTGDLIIPDSVAHIGASAFQSCSGFNGNLIISNSVTVINNYTFSGCNGFTGDLIIPESVTLIDVGAFYDCNGFTGDLIISDSVTSIGICAFYNCSGFTGNLMISDSVTHVGASAFYNCSSIDNFIFRIDESFANSDYRKDIFDELDISRTVVEMSYNFHTSGTWLDVLSQINNGKPIIKIERNMVSEDDNVSISLYIPTPYKEDNIVILRNGEDYVLPSKASDGKYIFNEEGIYNITLTTDLGTVSNIEFEVVPLVHKPDINYANSLVSIFDNGHSVYEQNELLRIENFEDPLNNIFGFTNNNWIISNGVLKSEDISSFQSTENKFKVNAVNGDNLKIAVRISSESNYDFGCIYLNGTEVYRGIGNNTSFDIIKLDLIDGENVITFKYTKNDVRNNYEGAMLIDLIEFSGHQSELADIDRIEYRLNGGEWQTYTSSFRIPDELVNGVDAIKLEARVVVKDKVSKITECSLTIPKAQIYAEDIVVTQGDNFNELDFVAATDIDGTDITKKVTVVSSNVNLDKPGKYTIIYKVEGSNDYFTEKEIKVTVIKKELPPILIGDNVSLNKGEGFDPLDFVEATDSDGNSIDKSKIEIIENTVNVLEPGNYRITYRLIDDNGFETTKSIVVAVKESLADIDDSNNNIPDENNNENKVDINSTDKIPSTGGFTPLLYLVSAVSFVGGCYFISKKNG